MRTFLWVLTGIVLGGIIHLVVVLSLPSLVETNLWSRMGALGADGRVVVLPAATAGAPNPLGLDPELAYAACRIDLRQGPGFVRGVLPLSFWSLAVYNAKGIVLYSTTNRDGVGSNLDLGIFNAVQTRLLAEQRLDVAEGMIIVEAPENDVIVVVRLAPGHPAMRARYEAQLGRLGCGNLPA